MSWLSGELARTIDYLLYRLAYLCPPLSVLYFTFSWDKEENTNLMVWSAAGNTAARIVALLGLLFSSIFSSFTREILKLIKLEYLGVWLGVNGFVFLFGVIIGRYVRGEKIWK